jgi:uncharacterized protein YlxW (UPF0749 family)
MTKTGLEKIKRADDSDDKTDQLDTDQPNELKKELRALKEERLQLQKEVEKAAKQSSKIDLEEGKALNKVNKAAAQLTDLHWVIDRFTH